MANKGPHLLTPDGLKRLEAELKEARTAGRERVAERLQRAHEDGQDDDCLLYTSTSPRDPE